MKKARTQVEHLVSHMQRIGPISVREAMLEYKVGSLSRRMVDIQEMGYKVVKFDRVNPVTNNVYVRYGLEGGPGVTDSATEQARG